MGVRNLAAGRDVKEAIVNEIPAAKVDVLELDLSSMTSVRKFAAEFMSLGLPLNILINNAGIIRYKEPIIVSQDNVELTFATNHLGHFLLTNLVLETMKSSARQSNVEGRIINVSSVAHTYSYPEGIRFGKINNPSSGNLDGREYCHSKLANILHANELARRLKEDGVQITANSLHPGLIHTDIWQSNMLILNVIYSVLGRFVVNNVQQGASTTCYVALHPNVKGISGQYFAKNNISKASTQSENRELAKELWDFSMSLIS